ncbi:hypothetical protein HPB47_016424 [Ixodes persulcatus]|uniref:Uncharacterized protein n=1 Tax=Ixodes persulcatus TaxID=34615 RepID=A0AC60QQY0_IXOPE|nr:hypothetical protein HPB47_016424 [Ixodes persulcatus]
MAPRMRAIDAPFTLRELRHAIDTCPCKRSSPGPDVVINQAIRTLNESCHDSLFEYMNNVWSSAEIPRAWREATTVSLPKIVRPADELSSYRPISLTFCLRKLLEQMLPRRLNCHLEAVDTLPDCFTGFRRHRSTADSITDLAIIMPAVDAVLQKMRTRTNTLRTFGGKAWGTLQAMMLAMHRGLVVSCPTYALPLVALNSTQHENLEKAQREGLRICLGTPRSASSHKIFVEAGVATICATLQKRALRHLIKMKNGRSMGSLIVKIAQKTVSTWTRALSTRRHRGNRCDPGRPPTTVRTSTGSGNQAGRQQTTVILRTFALSHIEDQYHGWPQVFTDGSVRPTEGSSTAAAAFEAAGVGLSEGLTHHATSTTTDLAAILLALKTVQKGSTRGGKWVIVCDSQAAFSMLHNFDRAPPLARRIATEAMASEQLGHLFRFQWLPSHCGIKGKEIADQMANFAHDEPSTARSKLPTSADAKLLVVREIASQHPDARMAQGDRPARLAAQMNRATAAVFHRLWKGSALTRA